MTAQHTGHAVGRAASALSAAVCLALCAPSARAQGAAVSYIPWHKTFPSVQLGDGLEIKPGQITKAGGQGAMRGPAKWQVDNTSFTLINFNSLSQTMQSLNVNAWGEANGFLASESFSVDWSTFQAFQGSHRVWMVVAETLASHFLDAPALSAAAQAHAGDPDFEQRFGNYVVTQIQYRKRVFVKFDLAITSSVSRSSLDAAVQGSADIFSTGVSYNSYYSQLSNIGQTTITVTVEGQSGSTIIAPASGGDLDQLRANVQTMLAGWTTPTSVSNAGAIDTVWVTPWSSIPGAPAVVAGSGPNQDQIAFAVEQYVYLVQQRDRLLQIQQQDRHLNPTLAAYVASKLNTVVGLLGTARGYLQSLVAGDTPAPPDLTFDFQDPDVVYWRVLQGTYGYETNGRFVGFWLELNSNAHVHPTVSPGVVEFYDWVTNLSESTDSNGHTSYGLAPRGRYVPEVDTYRTHLDPVTGIPHRYLFIQVGSWDGYQDFTFALITDGGQPFTDAVDWNGWPAPVLVYPGSEIGHG